MKTSKLLTENVVDTRPIAIQRDGMMLQTSAGNVFEISSGSHATAIGHDNGKIIYASIKKLHECNYALTGRSIVHRAQIDLAEYISQALNEENAKIFFTSGGTEAVETAIRIAQFVQKQRGKDAAIAIVGRKNSYHGMSLLTRNIASHPIHSQLPEGLDLKWPKLPEPKCVDCPLGQKKATCSLDCALALQSIINKAGANAIAAVIFEPISGSTGGALLPPDGYIQLLAQICRENEILLIADETVTAFGRTGQAFITDLSKDVDIIVGGKTLGGGFIPINAVMVSSELCLEFLQNEWKIPLRLTFSGSPIVCAVALSVQNYIMENDLLSTVSSHTSLIYKSFYDSLMHRSDVYFCGLGHLWGIEAKVEKGKGQMCVSKIKRVAENEQIEFMGGFRQYNDHDSIHIMFTPIFDATDEEIYCGVQAATKLLLSGLE